MARPPDKRHVVAFRVSTADHAALRDLAEDHSDSPGRFARHLVLERLRLGGVSNATDSSEVDETLAGLLEEIGALRADTLRLRRTLVAVLELVLLNLTEASREQVFEIIRSTFDELDNDSCPA